MKLVFRKDGDAQVSVLLRDGDQDQEFSYVAMVKALMEDKKLEDPVTLGDFTGPEVESIKGMVNYINEEIPDSHPGDE